MRIVYSFQTIKRVGTCFALWICFAFIHALAMAPILPIPFGRLLIDGFIFATLIVFIGFLYKKNVKSDNSSLIISPQTGFNYITLGIFVVFVWLGGGLLILYVLFPENNFHSIIPTIPVRALLGLLMYVGLVIYDSYACCKQEEIETTERNDEEEVKITPQIIEQLDNDNEIIERIAVKSGQKIQVILVPDIFYLQADGDYVTIFTEKGKYLKEQTMKYFELHLPKTKFVRIHRSCIVNIEMISRIELYKKQQQMIILKNSHQIKASVAGYKTLKSTLQL